MMASERDGEILMLRNPPRGARRFVLLERGAERMLDALAHELVAFHEAENKFERSLMRRLMHWGYPLVMFVINIVLLRLALFPILSAGLVLASVGWSILLVGGTLYGDRIHRRGEILFAQIRMFTTLVQVEAVKPAVLPEETS